MMLYWKADVDAYGRVEKGNTGRRLKKEQETSIRTSPYLDTPTDEAQI